MAEDQQSQERTEQPTQRRREDAKKKGQVPRSKELNIMLSLLFAASAFLVLGPGMSMSFASLFESALVIDRSVAFDADAMAMRFVQVLLESLRVLLPFFGVMLVGALAGPLLMGGWSFSVSPMAFKLEKISPLSGLKKIFSAKGLMELLKALFKFIVLISVATVLIVILLDEILTLGLRVPLQAIVESMGIVQWSFLVLSAAMISIVVFDVPFELWNHNRQLKMTKREVQDELKESEGRPEVKNRIRTLQREASQHRMMEAAKTADVVITNPTHFAVALKYDSATHRAPLVVAKGTDLVALRIRSIATGNGITVFEAPPLARALFASTELGREVPENLYLAVARVLAYVYQLRTGKSGEYTPRPHDLEIPEEYMKFHGDEGTAQHE
ncbi:MAG: flagellar biosynthesis protein FlhB [Halioglobus sp.]|nr:flagellar biosynthesis protein FlhB [Halioglobus sp.]